MDNSRNMEKSRLAKMIRYLNQQLGIPTRQDILMLAKNYQHRTNVTVKSLEEEVIEKLVYMDANKQIEIILSDKLNSNWIADWVNTYIENNKNRYFKNKTSEAENELVKLYHQRRFQLNLKTKKMNKEKPLKIYVHDVNGVRYLLKGIVFPEYYSKYAFGKMKIYEHTLVKLFIKYMEEKKMFVGNKRGSQDYGVIYFFDSDEKTPLKSIEYSDGKKVFTIKKGLQ